LGKIQNGWGLETGLAEKWVRVEKVLEENPRIEGSKKNSDGVWKFPPHFVMEKQLD